MFSSFQLRAHCLGQRLLLYAQRLHAAPSVLLCRTHLSRLSWSYYIPEKKNYILSFSTSVKPLKTHISNSFIALQINWALCHKSIYPFQSCHNVYSTMETQKQIRKQREAEKERLIRCFRHSSSIPPPPNLAATSIAWNQTKKRSAKWPFRLIISWTRHYDYKLATLPNVCLSSAQILVWIWFGD